MGESDISNHRHLATSSAAHHEADSALAGLWGGSGNITASRAWDSGSLDGDRQLRAMKNSMQVLQLEVIELRTQLERSAENEGRLRAQLQRVLLENDAALVMLGQVRTWVGTYVVDSHCECLVTCVCSERRSSRFCARSLKM